LKFSHIQPGPSLQSWLSLSLARPGQPIVLTIIGPFGRSGSHPQFLNDTKLLLVRTTMIDKGYQRTRKKKEIMYDKEWL